MDDRQELLHPPPDRGGGRLALGFTAGLLITAVGIWALVLDDGASGSDAEQAIPDGAVVLFNGEDLTGWTVHGTELWCVENGELISESGPDAEYGYLRTDETYTDFDLTAEFRQEADGNSGLFFRSTIEQAVLHHHAGHV